MIKLLIFISAIAIAYFTVYCAIRMAIRDEVAYMVNIYEITKIND